MGKKIMIVDDEYYFRQGFKTMFAWQKYGYDAFCEAKNGKEALAMVEQEQPDLIFLDVNMPMMNGIDFLKQYSQRVEKAPVVLLTGFSEFEFAKQAIRYGAFDYLLKTVKWKDITDVLDRLEQKKTFNEEQQKPRLEMDHTTKQLLRDKLMMDMVNGNIDSDLYVQQYASFLEFLPSKQDHRAIFMILNKGDGWSGSDLRLWKYAVSNIAAELMEQEFNCQIFNTGESELCMLIWDKEENRCNKNSDVVKKCNEIHKVVQQYIHITLYFGLGEVCTDGNSLKSSFENACSAARYGVISRTANVVVYHQDDQKDIWQPVFKVNEKHDLLVELRIGHLDNAREIVDRVFKRLLANCQTADQIELLMDEFNLIAHEAVMHLSDVGRNIDIPSRGSDTAPLYSDIEQLKTEVFELMEKVCRMTGDLSTGERSTSAGAVESAKQYILQNYGDSSLSEAKIAAHVFVNRSHLCSIFKKSVGTTIVKYITDIRMKKAQELFDKGNCMIQDVSDQVGYADANYFGKTFKKRTGLTPSQYIAMKRCKSKN